MALDLIPEAWGATFYGAEVRDALSFGYLEDLIRENPDHLLIRTGMVLIIATLLKIGAASLFRSGCPMFIMVRPCPLPLFYRFLQKLPDFLFS